MLWAKTKNTTTTPIQQRILLSCRLWFIFVWLMLLIWLHCKCMHEYEYEHIHKWHNGAASVFPLVCKQIALYIRWGIEWNRRCRFFENERHMILYISHLKRKGFIFCYSCFSLNKYFLMFGKRPDWVWRTCSLGHCLFLFQVRAFKKLLAYRR